MRQRSDRPTSWIGELAHHRHGNYFVTRPASDDDVNRRRVQERARAPSSPSHRRPPAPTTSPGLSVSGYLNGPGMIGCIIPRRETMNYRSTLLSTVQTVQISPRCRSEALARWPVSSVFAS